MRVLGKMAAGFAILIVGLVLATGGYLFLTGRQHLERPAPRGPFTVGRTNFDWIDTSREDEVAPAPGSQRELMVWVWYPAQAASAPRADYFPEPLLSADRKLFLRGPVTKLLMRDPGLVQSHSLDHPQVGGEGRFPIIVFRPGFGALSLQYTTLAEDLASRGYFVVAIDAPYSAGVVAYPDGRIATRSPKGSPSTAGPRSEFDRLVRIWAADSSFVVSQLAILDREPASPFHDRLDLTRVGAFGHSFGGAASAEFCALDVRCSAAIDIDGLLFGKAFRDGVGKSFMFLLTDHSGEADKEAVFADFKRIYELSPAGRAAIEVRGMRHFNVSDLAFLRSPVFLSRALGALGPIDRTRGMRIVSDYVAAFFDKNLKDQRTQILENRAQAYSEVRQLWR